MQIKSFSSRLIPQWNRSEKNSGSSPIDEKTKTQDAKESAAGDQSRIPVNFLSANSIVSEVEAKSSPFVKKYELNTGGKKVNVRIFREPPEDPVIQEPKTT
jgi:hypothetical protein